jgi:O-antigen/teichoic acid export membrane protein/O-antigen ligase
VTGGSAPIAAKSASTTGERYWRHAPLPTGSTGRAGIWGPGRSGRGGRRHHLDGVTIRPGEIATSIGLSPSWPLGAGPAPVPDVTTAGVLSPRTALRRLPPAPVVVVGAVICGAVIGLTMATSVRAGLGLLFCLFFIPIAFVDLPLGVGLWLPFLFFPAVSALNEAGKVGGLVLIAAWLWSRRWNVVRWRRGLNVSVGLVLLWATLSVGWAASRHVAAGDLWHWYALGALFVVISTVITDERSVRLMLGGFVVGGVLTVLLARLSGGLSAGKNAELSAAAAAQAASRLRGGIGDPNFLAAALLAAAILGLGLLPSLSRWRRWLVAVAVVVITVGIGLTQSRGGFIGAAVALVLAFAVFPRHRKRVAVIALIVGFAAVVFFASSPAAWHSVNANNRGDGRDDLWKVAEHITADHPLTGVGVSNYQVVAPGYVNRVGSLQNVDIIAGNPHEVHNTYLELTADQGLPGLALFGVFALGCVGAAWRASKRYQARRDVRNATVAGAVFVAQCSMLVTAFFLSAQEEQLLWVVLALGPALLTASERGRAWITRAPPESARKAGVRDIAAVLRSFPVDAPAPGIAPSFAPASDAGPDVMIPVPGGPEGTRSLLGRSAAVAYGSNVMAAMLSLVSVLITSRYLGPTGRGEVVFLTTMAMITAQLATLGVNQAVANFASRDPARAGTFATNSLILSGLFGVAAAGVLAAAIAAFPAVGGHSRPWLLAIVLASLPMLILQLCLQQLAVALYHFVFVNTTWLLPPLVNVTVNAGLVLTGRLSVATAVLTWLAGNALATAVLLWAVVNRFGGFGRPDRAQARAMIGFGSKAYLGRAMFVGNYRMDQWILGSLSTAKELGTYSVAVAWSEALFFLPTALTFVQRPDLVRGTRSEARRQTVVVFRYALWVTMPLAVAMIVFAPFLCVTLFGSGFHESIGQLRVLVVGTPGIIALKLFGNALTAQRHPLREAVAGGIAFASIFALDFSLIPTHGGMGASVASAIAYTLGGLTAAGLFVRTLSGRWSELLPRWGDIPALSSAAQSALRGSPAPASTRLALHDARGTSQEADAVMPVGDGGSGNGARSLGSHASGQRPQPPPTEDSADSQGRHRQHEEAGDEMVRAGEAAADPDEVGPT